MNISQLRLITFDVTGTLLKFRASPGKQYGEVGAKHGIECDNKVLSSKFKSHWRRMNNEHPNFGHKSGIGWEIWWKQIVVETFKDSRLNLDESKLHSIAADLIKLYETSLCWQQSHGALGLLSYLKNKGIPLGVISNFDPRLEVLLKNTKLRHYFNFVVGSYEAGIAKPHGDIFNLATRMAKIEHLQPEHCLHIGDTPSLDYQGAKKSGWNAILISNLQRSVVGRQHPYVNSNHVYSSLYDLHKYFIEGSNAKLLSVQQ